MKKFKKPLLILITILSLGVIGFCYLTFFEGEVPQIILSPKTTLVKAGEGFKVEVKDQKQGLKEVEIFLFQQNNKLPLLKKQLNREKEFSWHFNLPPKLKAGEFTLHILVRDYSLRNLGKGNLASFKQTFTYDPNPPLISLLSRTHYLNQGGSGLIVFKLNEPVQKTGVQIGNYFFPAYQFKDNYYCLFAWPYDLNTDTVPELIAQDLAGNIAQTGFYYHVNARRFPKDKINLPLSFLKRKMPYFQKYFPQETDPLQLFLKVNQSLRQENRVELRKIGQQTLTTPMLEGSFLRLPNAARRASFAEERTYYFEGKQVDKQTHLGLDLASIARAKVPAANKGVVVFAQELGIYGQVVILDHGLGLQTLYAHLSEIKVKPGEKVQKGQIIGRTGDTGLAGGDHLHFAVLISGVPVNPVEWFDANWLKNNIYDRL